MSKWADTIEKKSVLPWAHELSFLFLAALMSEVLFNQTIQDLLTEVLVMMFLTKDNQLGVSSLLRNFFNNYFYIIN